MNARMLAVPQNRNDLFAITELCNASKVCLVIDKQYSFDEIPEAMRYIGKGRVKEKVVITVQHD